MYLFLFSDTISIIIGIVAGVVALVLMIVFITAYIHSNNGHKDRKSLHYNDSTEGSWAGFYNHLIRLKYNPRYYLQDNTYVRHKY